MGFVMLLKPGTQALWQSDPNFGDLVRNFLVGKPFRINCSVWKSQSFGLWFHQSLAVACSHVNLPVGWCLADVRFTPGRSPGLQNIFSEFVNDFRGLKPRVFHNSNFTLLFLSTYTCYGSLLIKTSVVTHGYRLILAMAWFWCSRPSLLWCLLGLYGLCKNKIELSCICVSNCHIVLLWDFHDTVVSSELQLWEKVCIKMPFCWYVNFIEVWPRAWP